jgi:hypothetical protein
MSSFAISWKIVPSSIACRLSGELSVNKLNEGRSLKDVDSDKARLWGKLLRAKLPSQLKTSDL